jgi:Ni,Fe-hydrogenase III large subunit/Ni,Fe-hydrogenase III component G
MALTGIALSNLGGEAPAGFARVSADEWTEAARQVHESAGRLVALWGADERDVGRGFSVHAAYATGEGLAVLHLPLPAARPSYPDLSGLFAPAGRMQRAAYDLLGIVAEGANDTRPWLRHGAWRGDEFPLRRDFDPSAPREPAHAPYPFVRVEGDGVHEIAVGPIHAGVIEPGHFRFSVVGEKVLRLEERLGYTHKGIDRRFGDFTVAEGYRLAGRCSGDSTVAYAWAYAQAAESALAIVVPPRARWLRALMLEAERIANHLGDLGALGNDAAFGFALAQFSRLREDWLRLSGDVFGHRMMMDRIVPGGVICDLSAAGAAELRALLDETRRVFPRLVDLYDNTASLQDRTAGTGILREDLARQFGAGGYVGRASGRAFDARKRPGYPPYDRLDFAMATFDGGDVNARVWVRIREVEQSLDLVEQILRGMPLGPIKTDVRAGMKPAEGMALVEGFRGDVLVWLRIENGRVARAHLRDPSWFQWPLLEAAIEGNIVADFPLCNKSFNCSYSGHDL